MSLEVILSVERFATYKNWAGGDALLAEWLYSYNIQLSADFYGSLHMLEIVLRNKIDQALIASFGSNWTENKCTGLDSYQQKCLSDARSVLLHAGKIATHSQIIAELNFGFWSSLFGKSSNHLWGKILRPIFNMNGLQRSTIAEKLRNLRRLRNRVAHYEPILALPLLELRNDLLLLAGWLSSDAEIWIKAHTKIEYLAAPIIIRDCTTDAFVFDRNFLSNLPN